jgi:hypothetical protein
MKVNRAKNSINRPMIMSGMTFGHDIAFIPQQERLVPHKSSVTEGLAGDGDKTINENLEDFSSVGAQRVSRHEAAFPYHKSRCSHAAPAAARDQSRYLAEFVTAFQRMQGYD